MVSDQEQIVFLRDVQRLITEGQFTATYKFALILALADIAVEQGNDGSGEMEIETTAIAEKFIQYYWRHTKPFTPGHGTPFILRQNLGNTPAVITELIDATKGGFTSLTDLQKESRLWKGLVGRVRRTVCNQPLRYLPTLASGRHSFLYEDSAQIQAGKVVECIRLKPGVMFCLRRFYDLVADLVRGAWVRYARRNNADNLGAPTDLDEFLFGSERSSLSAYVSVLRTVQNSRCFYCDNEIKLAQAHVDHFIPWSLYPADLGHNFVLAHATCNSAKADHLAAIGHFSNWMKRNRSAEAFLKAEFDKLQLLHNQEASIHVAKWAYGRTGTAAMTWVEKAQFEVLPSDWLSRVAA